MFSDGIFEEILASMLRVFIVRKHTRVDAKSKNGPESQNEVKGQQSAKIAYIRGAIDKFAEFSSH